MLIQHHINDPSFSEKFAGISMMIIAIVMWLVVLGCVVAGVVALIYRETQAIG